MSHLNSTRVDSTITQRFAAIVSRTKARAQLRGELRDTSDRGLAELSLSRGDVEDVVAGTYRRAA